MYENKDDVVGGGGDLVNDLPGSIEVDMMGGLLECRVFRDAS